jgi:hypothetical protein
MARSLCETHLWIDVRRLHRDGQLLPGQSFPYSWSQDGKACGTIRVVTEPSAIVLSFRAADSDSRGWRSVEQRVPVVWTLCNLGGGRPWFRCAASVAGKHCGRRVAILYLGSSTGFACRHCYDLSYASQLESVRYRGLGRARKIRMKLQGGPNLSDAFPIKPKRMHRRTYKRFVEQYIVAAVRCGAL